MALYKVSSKFGNSDENWSGQCLSTAVSTAGQAMTETEDVTQQVEFGLYASDGLFRAHFQSFVAP